MPSSNQTISDIIKIGKNPKLRPRLINKYHHGNFLGVKTGEQGDGQDIQDFAISELSLNKKLALLRGLRLLLANHVKDGDCVCHMPPAVTLPIAIFADLLRKDEATAKRAWRHFKEIQRYCAERVFGQKNLAALKLSQFLDELTKNNNPTSAAEQRELAAIRLEKVYRL